MLRTSVPLWVVLASVCIGFQIPVDAQMRDDRVTSTPAVNERPLLTEDDIQVIRQTIRSHAKQIIAANVKLTDGEAERFWPVYDQYMSELDKIEDTKYALIKQEWESGGIMSDSEAESTTNSWLEMDRSIAQLRLKYIPNFRRVIPPRKTALFCQIERELDQAIDVQLAGSLPVIQP